MSDSDSQSGPAKVGARRPWIPWLVVGVAGAAAISIAAAVILGNARAATPDAAPPPGASASAQPSPTPDPGCPVVTAPVHFPDAEAVEGLPESDPAWAEVGRIPLRSGSTFRAEWASTVTEVGEVTVVGSLVTRSDGSQALVYAGFDRSSGVRLWEESFLGISDLSRQSLSDPDGQVMVVQLAREWGGTSTFLSMDVRTGETLASVDVAGAYFILSEAIVRPTYDPLYRTVVTQPRDLVHIVKSGGIEARAIDTMELVWELPIETPEYWEGTWAALAGDVIVVHEQLYSAADGGALAPTADGWTGVAGNRLVERRWVQDGSDTIAGWDSESGSACWEIDGVEDFLQTEAGGIVVREDGAIQQVDTADGSIIADWGAASPRVSSGRLAAGGYLQEVDDGWSFIPSPGAAPVMIPLGVDPTWAPYAHDAERIALIRNGRIAAYSLTDGSALWSTVYEGDVHVAGGRVLSVRGVGSEIIVSELR